MENFFSRWQPGEINALASILTALAALIVAPIVGHIASKRQRQTSLQVVERQISASARVASEQIEASLKIAQTQIEATSISTKRQEWINTLRNELTTILALVSEIGGSPQEFPRIHSKFITAFSKIQLLLNPLENDHSALTKAIDAYYRAITASGIGLEWKANEDNYRGLLVLQSQLILKKEWTVIRFGTSDENRLIGIREEISVLEAKVIETQQSFRRA
jgi:hypothetical protein